MSKRKLNIVLIAALAIIWSFVGYKYFSGYFASSELDSLPVLVNTTQAQVSVKRDTFRLKELPRDPFLGSYKRSKPETNLFPLNDQIKRISRNEKVPKIWPRIEYFGFVKNENSSSPLVVIKVDNQLERLRKNQDFNGIKIREIFEDSIVVSKGKERKVFLRS